ncbi:MAG: hypothetical protein ACFFE2_03830 [Candidatus Thorarchaeota archaeon]
MARYELENKADFVPAWISYLSTATGILKALGVKTDLVDVGGYTGYAFHLNTAEHSTCPSAPTVAPFDKFSEGLESFGWKIKQTWDRPGKDYSPSDNEKQKERARNYFSEVKDTIRKTGRPIGIWGIPEIPEFGIVNGFDDDNYIVSTFRSLPHIPVDDSPIHHLNLNAPGGLFKMVFGDSFKARGDVIRDREAVARGISIAKGLEKVEGYISGPEAFDDWANTLEEGIVAGSEKESKDMRGATQLMYHGNAYVAQCTQEGLNLASVFLERLADRHRNHSFSKNLAKASIEYRKAAVAMQDFTELFPFSHDKDWKPDEFPDDKKQKGARSLRNAKPHVESAIQHMEDALKMWSKKPLN